MNLRHYLDLLIIFILNTILLLVILFIPLDALRITLGLPYALFFPGYTLIAALFTRRGSLDSIERLALCFGLSIAVVPLIGLILNYTPWGIRLLPSLLSLYVFMLAMSLVAFLRRRALPEEERFCFDLRKAAPEEDVHGEETGADQQYEVVTVHQKGNLINRYSITGIIVLALFITGWIISAEAWQIGLSIPIVLAAGYLLAGIIFPQDDELRLVVRIFMSLCFSMVLGLLTAIVSSGIASSMNFEPPFSTLFIAFAAISIILAVVAALLRYRQTRISYPVRKLVLKDRGRGKIIWLDRILNVVLVLAILTAIGAIVYTVSTPKTGEKFTEFYILGLEGKAESYPRQLQRGEEASIILGIVNHEYELSSYKYVINIDGLAADGEDAITLQHEEKWEQIVTFKPTRAGDNQKVEFLLYKLGSEDVYLDLHIWIDVLQ